MRKIVELIDYEKLMTDYERNLLHQLRGFGSDKDYLGLWVPSDDLQESLVSLLYALKDSEFDGCDLQISLAYCTAHHYSIQEIIDVLGHAVIKENNNAIYLISISDLQSYHYQLKPKIHHSGNESVVKKGSDNHLNAHCKIDIDAHYDLSSAKLLDQHYQDQSLAEKTYISVSFKTPCGASLFLSVEPEKNSILNARFESSDPVLSKLLIIFCASLVARPIQEAADHGVSTLEYKLRKPSIKSQIRGMILLSAIRGPFLVLDELIKGCFLAYIKVSGYEIVRNRWYKNPSAQWYMLSDPEKRKAVQMEISSFSTEKSLDVSIICLHAIEKVKRIVVTINDDKINKPIFLRELEVWLKHKIDSCIEVYYQEMADNNKLRKINFMPGNKEKRNDVVI